MVSKLYRKFRKNSVNKMLFRITKIYCRYYRETTIILSRNSFNLYFFINYMTIFFFNAKKKKKNRTLSLVQNILFSPTEICFYGGHVLHSIQKLFIFLNIKTST